MSNLFHSVAQILMDPANACSAFGLQLYGRGSGGIELPDSSGWRQRDGSDAAAAIDPFAADGKGCIEAQPRSPIEEFKAVLFSLRDPCAERFTFEHHWLDVDFPTVQSAGVGPFDWLSRTGERFVSSA